MLKLEVLCPLCGMNWFQLLRLLRVSICKEEKEKARNLIRRCSLCSIAFDPATPAKVAT